MVKKSIKFIILLCIITFIITYTCNSIIVNNTQNKVYDSLTNIPKNNVGLLLGTGKYLKNGVINPYYLNRIIATSELYKAGKIKKIVISGDNSTKNYNEPQTMCNDLLVYGIPIENIYLDFAGFRTLDSVYRLNSIFGQDQFTIISQKFHNERAIYIAQYLKLNAIGYNAKDVTTKQGLKTNIREKFARVKVFIDRIIDKKPKYLGDQISIE